MIWEAERKPKAVLLRQTGALRSGCTKRMCLRERKVWDNQCRRCSPDSLQDSQVKDE